MRAVEEKTFATHDGVELFYRYWPAVSGAPKGAILLFHRGHEHSGRMAHLPDEFDLPDFAVETSLTIRAATYFDVAPGAMKQILEDQEGVRHACEAETSMMMVAAPDTVKRERFAEAFGPAFSHSPSGLPAVQRFASFKEFSASGVIGDARRANADKGERLFAAVATALADAIQDAKTWG
jgi:creatinine amidohydrolase/Fe(II)-dependent formamide hydrolase-like protein